VESIKASVFQVIGIDIMIDSKYNAWLIEINNSPSMNIMFSKEFMPDEDDIELSEIDQEIKVPVLSDAFQLASLYRKDNE
jgi:D-alanine-D-alanine ligase-like ATP-grasp enzyme